MSHANTKFILAASICVFLWSSIVVFVVQYFGSGFQRFRCLGAAVACLGKGLQRGFCQDERYESCRKDGKDDFLNILWLKTWWDDCQHLIWYHATRQNAPNDQTCISPDRECRRRILRWFEDSVSCGLFDTFLTFAKQLPWDASESNRVFSCLLKSWTICQSRSWWLKKHQEERLPETSWHFRNTFAILERRPKSAPICGGCYSVEQMRSFLVQRILGDDEIYEMLIPAPSCRCRDLGWEMVSQHISHPRSEVSFISFLGFLLAYLAVFFRPCDETGRVMNHFFWFVSKSSSLIGQLHCSRYHSSLENIDIC